MSVSGARAVARSPRPCPRARRRGRPPGSAGALPPVCPCCHCARPACAPLAGRLPRSNVELRCGAGEEGARALDAMRLATRDTPFPGRTVHLRARCTPCAQRRSACEEEPRPVARARRPSASLIAPPCVLTGGALAPARARTLDHPVPAAEVPEQFITCRSGALYAAHPYTGETRDIDRPAHSARLIGIASPSF